MCHQSTLQVHAGSKKTPLVKYLKLKNKIKRLLLLYKQDKSPP